MSGTNERAERPDGLWEPGADHGDGFLSSLEEKLGALRPPGRAPSVVRVHRRPILGSAAAALLVIASAVAWLGIERAGRASWVLQTAAGEKLWREGDWLEVAGQPARAEIPRLGSIELEPGSRARLLAAGEREQRLELARGGLSAFIMAPPRLFVVEVPGATAFDMGCAYTLAVDEAGDGVLRVSAGWVELDGRGVVSRVPAGAMCEIEKARGPGIPRFEDADPAWAAAVDRLQGGDSGAIDDVLAGARARDTLTLWHVLLAAAPADRPRITDRILGISGVEGVDREALVARDADQAEVLWLRLWAGW